MKIEITKPTPEQQELQSLFQQTDKETIDLLVKENDELHEKLKTWQECAGNLIEYAHEFVEHLLNWGNDYGRYDKEIKTAEDAIEQYNKLKEETK